MYNVRNVNTFAIIAKFDSLIAASIFVIDYIRSNVDANLSDEQIDEISHEYVIVG